MAEFLGPPFPKESGWEAKVAPKTAPLIFVAEWHEEAQYAETATQQQTFIFGRWTRMRAPGRAAKSSKREEDEWDQPPVDRIGDNDNK